MSTPTLHARGAEVTVTEEAVTVTRSSVAASLFPDANIDPSALLGWYLQAPDQLSPGWIELLSRDDQQDLVRTRINYSPNHLEDFLTAHQRLTNLQAGYPLEDVSIPAAETDAKDESVTAEEWLSGGSTEAAAEEKESGGARRPAPWEKVATPDEVPEANPDADIDNPIFEQNVTVTGDVEPYDKGEVWDMIAEAGGTVGKNVTKKTTMLVVGEWASMTSKEKRARELQDKGQEIKILSFTEFLKAVGKA
ncbi:BRCT domain-containing protein [Corynebacterium dentalis]|uniref:BRCT domain-containing protein n=1 Tax=Corynebacterium dentalis TaxID=2014528 RepID=UPI00289B672C|nr:BRCT domain-containing protein [Corynebacterium dentalis]